jgi:DNA-binding beta-propeller fold protein YncE
MSLKILTLLTASLVITSITALQAQSSLIVLSKKDHTLAIVDPTSLKVIAKAPVGPDPHEVAVTPDGATAYVSNFGGGIYNTIDVIDLVAKKSLPVIDLGPLHGPHGIFFAGGKTWFTAQANRVIGRYDPATHKVDWIFGTGQNGTHMIDVSPDQKLIITTNPQSANVSLIEPHAAQTPPGAPARTEWNQTLIPVGKGDEGFDLTPDRNQLWTANSGDGTISIIDLASKKVIDTLASNTNGANRLKFTPDGRHVLVSLLSGPDLVILDTATRKVTQRIPICHGAAGIQMEPNGNRAFIACTPDDYVVVLDLHTFKVLSHLDAGLQPDGMAWATRH